MLVSFLDCIVQVQNLLIWAHFQTVALLLIRVMSWLETAQEHHGLYIRAIMLVEQGTNNINKTMSNEFKKECGAGYYWCNADKVCKPLKEDAGAMGAPDCDIHFILKEKIKCGFLVFCPLVFFYSLLIQF
jgi:hypothetical protein